MEVSPRPLLASAGSSKTSRRVKAVYARRTASFSVILGMIRSYRDKRTRQLADGDRVPQFDGFRRQAEKRLRILEAATALRDLAQLPSNRLEALSGDREGEYSIRINKQWRICFEWPEGGDGPENVEIVDYH